ncbi:hypothetical protein LINGRAPRIM_LOCUS1517 [Linum grandiflorum]
MLHRSTAVDRLLDQLSGGRRLRRTPALISVDDVSMFPDLNFKTQGRKIHQLNIRKDSNSTKPPTQLFIDTAVYARNCCFRLALSSRQAKLRFSYPQSASHVKPWYCEEEDMFMASLICNADSNTDRLLVCKNGYGVC